MTDQSVQFVHELVGAFPQFSEMLNRQDEELGEVLPHVFFGELTREIEAQAIAGQTDQLPAIMAFLERKFVTGDHAVRNVITVSFLEYLDDAVRLFLGPALQRECQEHEAYLRKLADSAES